MITYFPLIFHVLFIFFKGLVSFEIMSLKFIFFCPLMRLQFQLRGGGKGALKSGLKGV